MTTQISFEVREEDLERFAAMARKLKAKMPVQPQPDDKALAAAVREKLEASRSAGETSGFILERIDQLDQLADQRALLHRQMRERRAMVQEAHQGRKASLR